MDNKGKLQIMLWYFYIQIFFIILLIFNGIMAYLCKRIWISKISSLRKIYRSTVSSKFANFQWNMFARWRRKSAFKKISALRKVHIFWQLVMNFANFRENNRVLMQKNHAFKKYHPCGRFILLQLVANFADFRSSNSVCKEKKSCI